MFGLSKKEEVVTVKQVLDLDKVKKAVATFAENHMPTARVVILIWADASGDIHVSVGGDIQNECMARGMLLYADDIIKQEGIPND